jgi:hypothetical protein
MTLVFKGDFIFLRMVLEMFGKKQKERELPHIPLHHIAIPHY